VSIDSGPSGNAASAAERLLDDLRARGLVCAPQVISRLLSELGSHAPTIAQVAAGLSVAERQGLRPLPAPLPIVPAIARHYSGCEFSRRDRDLLLAVAATLDDGLEPILAFDGRSGMQVAASAVGRHLSLHAGKVRFRDPRLALWVFGTAPAADAVGVHRRLSEVFLRSGRTVDADWHRARAAVSGDPSAAPELTRIARELTMAGFADRALVIAREAAAHAAGPALQEARLVAGVAAATAGYAMDAAGWLGTLFPHGEERFRLHALPALLFAQAHLQGSVPDVDPQLFRPTTEDPAAWHAWSRAAALAAPMCAERGDRRGMRSWLRALAEASAVVDAGRTLRDPAVAVSWTLIGEHDAAEAHVDGPVAGQLWGALRAAADGDIDSGIRILAHGVAVEHGTDPLVKGFERTPVVRAYRSVAHALLLTWRGDIGQARDRLMDAALTLPVAVPFGGLGVVLARRLDLAVLGDVGPISRALTASLPVSSRVDILVDRAIRSFLSGDLGAASSHVRLWRDLGAPEPVLSIPGLEELVAPMPETPARPRVEPPDASTVRSLQTRIAIAADDEWERQRDDVLAISRTLRSPFARGRIEAMIGTRSALRGESASARRHLSRARSLLEIAGADAWVRLIEQRLTRLERHQSPSGDDPLAACRAAWGPRLTPRELEVAMAAVSGASNRDIAAALSVSVRTVEVHLGRAFAKVGARSRVELTVLAHRVGLSL
jgi:DNA-binding NarL/FixJ family response regulator